MESLKNRIFSTQDMVSLLEGMTPVEISELSAEASAIYDDNSQGNIWERLVSGFYYANDRMSDEKDGDYDRWKNDVISVVKY